MMHNTERGKLIFQYLKKYELDSIFSDISIEDIEVMKVRKGHMICSKGEEINHMFLVVEGKVKIYTITPDDKRLILRFQKSLGIIGDIEYIQGTDVLHTIEASSECLLFKIPFQIIRNTVGNDPKFLSFLLDVITSRFRAKTDAATLNLLYPVEVRIASFLLSTTANGEDKHSVYHEEAVGSGLKDIADMVGTSYRHLNRVIKKLCNEEIISRSAGKLFIKDLDRLKEIAKNNIYE